MFRMPMICGRSTASRKRPHCQYAGALAGVSGLGDGAAGMEGARIGKDLYVNGSCWRTSLMHFLRTRKFPVRARQPQRSIRPGCAPEQRKQDGFGVFSRHGGRLRCAFAGHGRRLRCAFARHGRRLRCGTRRGPVRPCGSYAQSSFVAHDLRRGQQNWMAIKLCNNRATPARCKVFTPTAKSPQCRPAPRRFSQDKQVYLSPEGRRRKHCARVPDNRNFDQTGDPT